MACLSARRKTGARLRFQRESLSGRQNKDGVFDIYYNKPFEIPAFDSVEVSPETLNKYFGVYTIAGTPAKFTVTRDGVTLFVQMNGQAAIPLEAITEEKFGIESAEIIFEFNVAKNMMIQKCGGRDRVFTKEK